MKKIALILTAIWLSFISLISPVWIGGIYMNITGHGKGYAYDMGAETDIAVFFGFILLLLWIIAVFPALIWLCKKFYQRKRSFILIPIIGCVAIFFIGILLIGWNEFIKLFGYPF
jgi:hypothetical protein